MSNTGSFMEKWNGFRGKVDPGFEKIGSVVGFVCSWAFRLRKFVMAAPVVYLALKFAMDNMERLPDMVGLNLQSSGEFALLVSKGYAVAGPLGVTVFCLFLMFCSRKTLFPWVISSFSLALPWLIYLTNLYPG